MLLSCLYWKRYMTRLTGRVYGMSLWLMECGYLPQEVRSFHRDVCVLFNWETKEVKAGRELCGEMKLLAHLPGAGWSTLTSGRWKELGKAFFVLQWTSKGCWWWWTISLKRRVKWVFVLLWSWWLFRVLYGKDVLCGAATQKLFTPLFLSFCKFPRNITFSNQNSTRD